jgi:hypothetical protein
MTCGEAVPVVRVGCVGGGWGGGLMSSHERWRSPTNFFLVAPLNAINFLHVTTYYQATWICYGASHLWKHPRFLRHPTYVRS